METKQSREIKREIFRLHGLEGLPDDELDKAFLFMNDKGGLVVRFKAGMRTEDWRMHVRHSTLH